MTLLGQITANSEFMHGRPAVRDARVRVADVLALLRADGSAAVVRYAAALHAAVADRQDIDTGDLEGVAMGFALAGRPQDALEVETIAQAFRTTCGGNVTTRFWAELRARHLDPIRSFATDPPDPATFADLAGALDRALSLARAAPAE